MIIESLSGSDKKRSNKTVKWIILLQLLFFHCHVSLLPVDLHDECLLFLKHMLSFLPPRCLQFVFHNETVCCKAICLVGALDIRLGINTGMINVCLFRKIKKMNRRDCKEQTPTESFTAKCTLRVCFLFRWWFQFETIHGSLHFYCIFSRT